MQLRATSPPGAGVARGVAHGVRVPGHDATRGCAAAGAGKTLVALCCGSHASHILYSSTGTCRQSSSMTTRACTTAQLPSCTRDGGDVFYARWDEVLVGATAVVSTIGGFGNEEQMKRINGEANVIAVDAAKEYGVPKFILISVHDYNLPSFLLTSGYFTGKRKAESEVLSKYPTSGVVLRPGYGKRKVDGFEVPLDVVGQPLERLLSSVENFTKPLSSLPASDLILAPPVNVDDVAYAVIKAGRKTRSSLARSARGWLGSAR